MSNFIVKLKNKSNEDKLHIQLLYEPKENKEITFRFGNSSKSLERKDLIFYDENLKILNPIEVMILTPKKYEKEEYKLSKNNPFVYDIVGEVDKTKNDVIIKLVSTTYLLKKGKKYYLELLYHNERSNRVEIKF